MMMTLSSLLLFFLSSASLALFVEVGAAGAAAGAAGAAMPAEALVDFFLFFFERERKATIRTGVRDFFIFQTFSRPLTVSLGASERETGCLRPQKVLASEKQKKMQ